MGDGYIYQREVAGATVEYEFPEAGLTVARELSVARYGLAGASVGDCALFAGGDDGGYCATVDAYNASLTRSTPTALSVARSMLAGATVGDYALFAGGVGEGEDDLGAVSAVVDAYNSSMVRSTPTALSVARQELTRASIGNYALFAGGVGVFDYQSASTVDAYNSSLTRSTPTALSAGRYRLAGTTVGDYALFAGGYGYGRVPSPSMPGAVISGYMSFDTVDAYSSALVRSTPDVLSSSRYGLGAAKIGDYALFAGGRKNSEVWSSTVDSYSSSLTRSTPTELSIARSGVGSINSKDYALFAGGYGGASTIVVDAYDENLTRSAPFELSAPRSNLAAATAGNYTLFAGGSEGSVASAVVDGVLFAEDILKLHIPKDATYSFNGAAEQTATDSLELTLTRPCSGYVKYKKSTYAD